MKNRVFLSLGTNLGDKEENLREAIFLLSKVGKIVYQSRFYEFAPWGFSSENLFLNMALEMQTELSPEELLDEILKIEKTLGREKKTQNGNYSDRKIDIDILFFNSQVFENERLVIPHPLISEREFVLEPLAEIAPNFIHPKFNISIAELLKFLKKHKENLN